MLNDGVEFVAGAQFFFWVAIKNFGFLNLGFFLQEINLVWAFVVFGE